MDEENISQEFRMKNIEETRNYLIKEIDQNELMSKKHKNAYKFLNYTEHFLILVSAVTGCFNFCIRFFAIGITSSEIELKIAQ